MRPVINLKPLNGYLTKTHFKMDTLSKVLNLVKTGDWAISLDLNDAYLHVPKFHSHRKYLRFCIQNQCYQFKVLCFAPTSAPRVFTKIVAVVAAYLRSLGKKIIVPNSNSSIAGVVQGKVIPIQSLKVKLQIFLHTYTQKRVYNTELLQAIVRCFQQFYQQLTIFL